jgi:hypothetical protein
MKCYRSRPEESDIPSNETPDTSANDTFVLGAEGGYCRVNLLQNFYVIFYVIAVHLAQGRPPSIIVQG